MADGTTPAETWSAQGTTPDAIEGALRELLKRRHAENGGFLPGRALNLVVFADEEALPEVRERLDQAGRNHAARLVLLSFRGSRERLDASARIASETEPGPGEFAVLRETVTVQVGACHLDDLSTIVDPLVVTDLPTLLWSPNGHPEAVNELLGLSQALLLDSIDEPVWADAIDRADCLSRELYVVDLAWLRSTPWRERIAATFDPPRLRGDLTRITQVTVRHHPDSTVAGLLAVGWLASRLGWRTSSLGSGTEGLAGEAWCGERRIEVSLLRTPELRVRGLAGVTLRTASGRTISLDRGDGGLRAHLEESEGPARDWTIVGASRGESGILADGIRQALMRDNSYGPALKAARGLV